MPNETSFRPAECPDSYDSPHDPVPCPSGVTLCCDLFLPNWIFEQLNSIGRAQLAVIHLSCQRKVREAEILAINETIKLLIGTVDDPDGRGQPLKNVASEETS